MEGRRGSKAGQLLIPVASAQSFLAGLISHLEREGESRGGEPAGEGLSPSPPSLHPCQLLTLHPASTCCLSTSAGAEGAGSPIFRLGVLLEGCLA